MFVDYKKDIQIPKFVARVSTSKEGVLQTGKFVASLWQVWGKFWASLWEFCGQFLAIFWQFFFGKYMASLSKFWGKYIASIWQVIPYQDDGGSSELPELGHILPLCVLALYVLHSYGGCKANMKIEVPVK